MNEMKYNEMKCVGFKIENHSNWKHKMNLIECMNDITLHTYVKWNVPIRKTMKKPKIEMKSNG